MQKFCKVFFLNFILKVLNTECLVVLLSITIIMLSSNWFINWKLTGTGDTVRAKDPIEMQRHIKILESLSSDR